MGLAAGAWFFRRIVVRQPATVEGDPADMGTEIGLEVSLGPVGSDLAEDATPVDERALGDDSPMSWLSRRLKRKR
jgi:hypothetical protein